MIIIYALIIFAASIVGSYLGGGSGVIIKPLLTLCVDDTTAVINFISSVAVFAMSISSLAKYLRQKTKVKFKTVLLISIGSICGGYLGKEIFELFINRFNDNRAMAIQAVMLAVMLAVSVLYINTQKIKFNLKNPAAIILCGIVLGTLSSFLGIGGGPINIMFLVLFFSMTMKDAAVYSVAIIFFSNISRFTTYAITGTVPKFDYRLLPVVIVSAIVAGIIGAVLNKKSNEKMVKKVYTVVLCAFVVLNIYNAAVGFAA